LSLCIGVSAQTPAGGAVVTTARRKTSSSPARGGPPLELVSSELVSAAGFEQIIAKLIEVELGLRVQSFQNIDLLDASQQLSTVDDS
jgi:hypothetical protein